MAKVMISIPEDLLAETDAKAAATGRSRSGLIQEALAATLAEESDSAAEALRRFTSAERNGQGGNSLALLKEMRRGR